MELDEMQQRIVEAHENKIVVIAGPGSGKTRVLTERIKYLLEHGANQTKLVAITFTNAAAQEIYDRLGAISKDCFIGTIHSYANKLLTKNGYKTTKIIKDERFDELFNEISKHPEVITEVENLLVDEFQDVSQSQFDFFIRINPQNFFVVGDNSQSIFSFNGAKVELFESLINDPLYTTYKMENNYRNGQNIINYSQEILPQWHSSIKKNIICKSNKEGKVSKLTGTMQTACAFIKQEGRYKDWFVLCRTNREINTFMKYMSEQSIPSLTFRKADLSNEALKKALDSDKVKVLTVHSSKGLESKNVLVWNFPFSTEEERRLGYVAATRASDNLIWCYGIGARKKKVYSRSFEF